MAEVSSVYLSAILGIEKTVPDNHAKYLNSWMRSLQNDPKYMRRAFSQARRVVEYLEALQNVEEDTKEQEQQQAA